MENSAGIEQIITEAYKLYMPQDRYEITELCMIVYEHFRNRKTVGYNVLEIGAKYGGTLYLWASLTNAIGKVISIDMSDGGLHGGIADAEMDKRDLWFYERFENVHFIRGDSHARSTLDQLIILMDKLRIIDLNPTIYPEGYQIINPFIDFLFIDGDHTYEGVKQDFEMYSPLVRRGGIVAFHDINDSERHRARNVHVSKFWSELVESKKYETIEINSNLDWAGIGVLLM